MQNILVLKQPRLAMQVGEETCLLRAEFRVDECMPLFAPGILISTHLPNWERKGPCHSDAVLMPFTISGPVVVLPLYLSAPNKPRTRSFQSIKQRNGRRNRFEGNNQQMDLSMLGYPK
jgi:hypothetical protein